MWSAVFEVGSGKFVVFRFRCIFLMGSSITYFIFPDVALQFLIIPGNNYAFSGIVAGQAALFQYAACSHILNNPCNFAGSLPHLLLQYGMPSNDSRGQMCCIFKSAHCHWFHLSLAIRPMTRLFGKLEICATSLNKRKSKFEISDIHHTNGHTSAICCCFRNEFHIAYVTQCCGKKIVHGYELLVLPSCRIKIFFAMENYKS